MSELPMDHFKELRRRINDRLKEIKVPHYQEQVEKFPWLYGALGSVSSETMFICENPSIVGIRQANVQTIDGKKPDIEAQWWGGPNNPAAKRFRRVLFELGLKESAPDVRGGWRCYITNVVKEANKAGDQARTRRFDRIKQSQIWADILKWELKVVGPRTIFAVGQRAHEVLSALQNADPILRSYSIHPIPHYSARCNGEKLVAKIKQSITAVLPRDIS